MEELIISSLSTLIDPVTAAELDGTISKASDSGKPWFGYKRNPPTNFIKNRIIPVPIDQNGS